MKEYIKKMRELGKMNKYIRRGGYLFISLDIYNAHDAIANAKPEEKTRTTVVETSKIAGGLSGAALGGFLVVTVASRGTSLIVLGLAAGTSAVISWVGGEAGEIIGSKSYDFFTD